MTPNTSQATDEQIVEAIATKIMRWHSTTMRDCIYRWLDENNKFMAYKSTLYLMCDSDEQTIECWSPLTNWNHWRQVEEKIMEDEKVWHRYIEILVKNSNRILISQDVMAADLRTRCLAALAALSSLPL